MRRAIRTLFGGGMIGKALGFGRDIVLAALYATSSHVDAFRVAQTAIFIPAHIVTGEGITASFIPLYHRFRRESAARAHEFFWMMFWGLALVSILLAGVVMLLARVWMAALVPGFSPESFETAVQFTRVAALALPFYVLGMLLSHLEMAHDRFTLASARAAVQNLGVLAGIVAAFVLRRPVFLIWGFTGAYMAFFAFGAVLVWRARLVARPARLGRASMGLIAREFWLVIRPLLLLPLFVQIGVIVERIVASWIGEGTVASLEYARSLSESGVVLIAWPIGLAGLATFSRLDVQSTRERLERMLPALLMAMLPLSAFLALHSAEIIRLLFARGAFGAGEVATTSPIFIGLALGFWAQVLGYVFVRVLNAQMRNREMALYVLAGSLVQAAIDVAAYRALGPLALGIGASAGSLATMVLAVRALGLTGAFRRYFLPLAAGAAVWAVPAWRLRGEGLGGLAFSFLCAAAFWTLFIILVPSLRRTAPAALKEIVKPVPKPVPAPETPPINPTDRS